MKVKELTNKMLDGGTKPRVTVFKYTGDAILLVYEGKPGNIDKENGELKVNSFLIMGAGLIQIFAEAQAR